jgi:hypothetical protein
VGGNELSGGNSVDTNGGRLLGSLLRHICEKELRLASYDFNQVVEVEGPGH